MAREQLFDRDPLADEHLELRPSEVVTRQRWIKGEWVKDVATLKVAEAPFAEGSMRQCWYAKKLSSRVTTRHIRRDSKHARWEYQRNYVLKRYKKTSPSFVACGQEDRKLLADDVQTQAESKETAREYNRELTALLEAGKFDRRKPKPMRYKCVDMLEPSLVYFPERDVSFFMEAYVEGNFRKYNDNAGYVGGVVDDEAHWRATPQAFSHFTFASSFARRIVVDVQGVGDLFTDPQIHTSDAVGFGVGNGGPKGFALFFATHTCNRVCRCMSLPPVWRLGDLTSRRRGSDDQEMKKDRLRGESSADDDESSSSSSEEEDEEGGTSSAFERRDAADRRLLRDLETALDDYGLAGDDAPLGLGTTTTTTTSQKKTTSPEALGHALSSGVAEALRPIVKRGQSSSAPPSSPHGGGKKTWHAAGSSCALAKTVHKTLGFMFLHGTDPILRTTSPASAVFHLAAAALGGDPAAAAFLAKALDARLPEEDDKDTIDHYREPKRARIADAATRAAALALLVVAVRNISSLIARS